MLVSGIGVHLKLVVPKASILILMTVVSAVMPCAFAQFNGWTVGDAGTILHTSDGTTWTPQADENMNFLYGVVFVDKMNGWAVGDGGTILHTSDGGTTWLSQNSGTTDLLLGVTFVDLKNGWVVGESGDILHTTDGGTTWNAQDSGVSAFLFSVSFVDANNGWAVGFLGTIVHTNNGGASWSVQHSGGDDLFGVTFVDANNGWAVGDEGTILHTSDGGESWLPQNSGTEVFLFGVSFVDVKNGWVVGDEGTILHTSDGGNTWTAQSSGVTTTLNGVSFVDANNGWAVGGSFLVGGAVHAMLRGAHVLALHPHMPVGPGIILKTTTGGASWTPLVTGVATLASVSFPHVAAAVASAPGTLDGSFQVKVFPNLTAGDSPINIGNTGASATGAGGALAIGGNLCVNVYVFSPDEQEVACCTCFVTPNGVVTTSARQLISKTLTPAVPSAVTVKLVATDGTGGAASCSAATPGALMPGLIAFGTNIHTAVVGGSNSSGTFAVTETPFVTSTLSAAELARISTLCGFILGNGTGFGVCPGCALGAAGGARH